MKNHSNSSRLNNQTPNHTRERNCKKADGISAIWPRFSLRDYAFCMATLFLFCLGSLFYQLNGGPPKVLVDIRQYLGKARAFHHLSSPRRVVRMWSRLLSIQVECRKLPLRCERVETGFRLPALTSRLLSQIIFPPSLGSFGDMAGFCQ